MGRKRDMTRKFFAQASTYGGRALRIASKVAEVAVHLNEKPPPLVVGSVIAKFVNTVFEDSLKPGNEILETWKSSTILRTTGSALVKVLNRDFEVRQLRGKQPHVEAVEVNGVVLGWLHENRSYVYVAPPHTAKEAEIAVATHIWERCKGRIEIRAHSEGRPWDNSLLPFPDPHDSVLDSPKAHEVFGMVEPFLDAGYSRSVLLHGPPGTGKSHIARKVADLAGGFSLRLSVQKMHWFEDALHFVELLQPRSLILDDIDRTNIHQLLSQIEIAHRIGLLLMTANNRHKLKGAASRVGRIDEIIEISELDSSLLEALVPETPPEIRERLKKLPAAYVDEFRRVAEILSFDEAVKRLPNWEERCQEDLEEDNSPKGVKESAKESNPKSS